MHAGNENDRRLLVARVVVNQRSGLEAVHARHVHVEQHHREFLRHHPFQGLCARVRHDQVLVEAAEDRLIRQQARRLIVHQQDIHLVFASGVHAF